MKDYMRIVEQLTMRHSKHHQQQSNYSFHVSSLLIQSAAFKLQNQTCVFCSEQTAVCPVSNRPQRRMCECVGVRFYWSSVYLFTHWEEKRKWHQLFFHFFSFQANRLHVWRTVRRRTKHLSCILKEALRRNLSWLSFRRDVHWFFVPFVQRWAIKKATR